jgi:hypothetical protein
VLLRFALNALVLLRVARAIGPVLVYSKRRYAPFPWASVPHETGHFYIAQTGHSHFAPTLDLDIKP